MQSIISALMKSDAWQDSVFILTYDEGGGPVRSRAAGFRASAGRNAPGHCPDPNNGSYGYCLTGKLGGTFDLTGFRVPLMVISPYAKPNFVSHTPRDYTAILAFIEKTFNVKALTARDAYWQDPSRDMSEFFDLVHRLCSTAPNGQPWSQVLNSQPTQWDLRSNQGGGPTK